MSILLTGFEPFGGAAVNPSWEAVRLVPDCVCGCPVHRLQLPVIYGGAAEQLLNEARHLRPEIVLCCGVAGGRDAVTPELVAINYRQAHIPDNAGQRFDGVPIVSGKDAAYMTRLPVNDMVAAIRAKGIPAQLSLSAGAYVCNDLYYHLLSAEQPLGYRGLFVHVPPMEKVSAADAARALTACLETIFQTGKTA